MLTQQWPPGFPDFLSDRLQCVRYHDSLSSWSVLKAGVPQGTLTGPATFLSMINDAAVPTESCNLTLKYVDDMTMVENITISSSSNMQETLDRFDLWASENNMLINPAKCFSMDITFAKNSAIHYNCLAKNFNQVKSSKYLVLKWPVI